MKPVKFPRKLDFFSYQQSEMEFDTNNFIIISYDTSRNNKLSALNQRFSCTAKLNCYYTAFVYFRKRNYICTDAVKNGRQILFHFQRNRFCI